MKLEIEMAILGLLLIFLFLIGVWLIINQEEKNKREDSFELNDDGFNCKPPSVPEEKNLE